jgi:hypothetical protein
MTRAPTLPLFAHAQGRRVRARMRSTAPAPKEIVLNVAVADLLRKVGRRDWRWSHFPAGELRDIRTAQKLKSMGVQRGWPDFLIFSPSGLLHALELKRRGGALSEDQAAFAAWCAEHSIPNAVAYSIDDAIATLTAWGALRKIGGAP